MIPKEIRLALDIDESTGFYAYVVTDQGILLKKVEPEELDENHPMVKELNEKAGKISLKKENLNKTIDTYRKTRKGGMDLI